MYTKSPRFVRVQFAGDTRKREFITWLLILEWYQWIFGVKRRLIYTNIRALYISLFVVYLTSSPCARSFSLPFPLNYGHEEHLFPRLNFYLVTSWNMPLNSKFFFSFFTFSFILFSFKFITASKKKKHTHTHTYIFQRYVTNEKKNVFTFSGCAVAIICYGLNKWLSLSQNSSAHTHTHTHTHIHA